MGNGNHARAASSAKTLPTSMSDAPSAISAIERLYTMARDRVRARVVEGGKLAADKLDREQLAAHAVAYLATELEASRQIVAWASKVKGAHEQRIADAYVAELARALRG